MKKLRHCHPMYYIVSYRYEDHRALDGGNDGMSVLREILQGSRFIVKDGG